MYHVCVSTDCTVLADTLYTGWVGDHHERRAETTEPHDVGCQPLAPSSTGHENDQHLSIDSLAFISYSCET